MESALHAWKEKLQQKGAAGGKRTGFGFHLIAAEISAVRQPGQAGRAGEPRAAGGGDALCPFAPSVAVCSLNVHQEKGVIW